MYPIGRWWDAVPHQQGIGWGTWMHHVQMERWIAEGDCTMNPLQFFFSAPAMASWRARLTRKHSKNLSESRIRGVQCYNCPTRRCSSGHNR